MKYSHGDRRIYLYYYSSIVIIQLSVRVQGIGCRFMVYVFWPFLKRVVVSYDQVYNKQR